jgi:hypothetical protein
MSEVRSGSSVKPRFRLHFQASGPAWGRWWVTTRTERDPIIPVTRYHETSGNAIREAGRL